MKIRAIITGVTGMVGEGVLNECFHHPDVEKILVINRKPCGFTHPKLQEIIHKDFFDLSPIESELKGYNACFFCLGVSYTQVSQLEYYELTYTLTLNFAETLVKYNPEMVFCYVSGKRTDSTETGKAAWARIKGKTENALMKLPFKKVYAFRPGFLQPTEGAKNVLRAYKYLGWMYPFLRKNFPNYASTLKELGLAMIHSVTKGYEKPVVEVADIVALSQR
jgi:hypothetical protein